MKTTRKVFSAVLAMFMIFSIMAVGFTAQAKATAADLQQAINNAISGGTAKLDVSPDVYGGSIRLTEPLVINGNIEINFNNITVKGAEGYEALVIKGGNVKVENGLFVATMADYSGATGLLKMLDKSKPAIAVEGGNVTLECVSAVGSMLRVPTKNAQIPYGAGIEVYGEKGGNLTAKNVIAIGLYGINNGKTGHSGAKVVVDDGIFYGIRRAFVSLKNVTFSANTTQYETIDFVEEFLKDGITMTAREREYIEYITSRLSNGVLCVANPSLTPATSDYDKDTDTLTVTAEADNTNNDPDFPDRNSYRYTPDTCTIDGQTVDFVEQQDGTFTATFAGIAGGKTLDADINYKLSVKLGEAQKEFVTSFLSKVDDFADQLPVFAGQCFREFDGLYEKLGTSLELVWSAYNELKAQGGSEFLTSDVCAEFRTFFGYCFTLYGAKLDKDTFNYVKKSPTRLQGMTNNLRNQFGATIEDNGDGILDKFDVYYNTVKSELLAYNENGKVTGFKDVAAAAKYVGDNYLDMYQLVKDAQPVLANIYETLTDPDSTLAEYTGSLSEYTDTIGTGLGYLNRATAKIDSIIASDAKYNLLVNAYGDKFGAECAKYTLKTLNILQNPDTYFEFDVDGDYANCFDFNQEATFTTPEDTEYCNVTVNISGYGKASVDGEEFATQRKFSVALGTDFSVAPVEYSSSDDLFQSILYTQPNTTWKVLDNGNSIKIGSDITITLMFSSTPSVSASTKHVVFVADKNLNYAWINDIEIADGDDFDIPEAFAFKDMTFAGWSLDKNCAIADAKSEDEIVTDIENATGDIFVYAIYDAVTEVVVPAVSDPVSIKATSDDAGTHRVYFEITLNAPDGYDIVQAGVIATKNTAYSSNLTLDLIGTAGVAVSAATTKGADGFIARRLVYTYGVGSKAGGTIYGVGYVVLKNSTTGEIKTLYTGVQSGALTPIV